MSRKDPIIEEIHAVREEMAREAEYDLDKILEAARERELASGVPTVQLPPRKPVSIKKAS